MAHRHTTDEELCHRATYHPPRTDETVRAHEQVRENITDLTVEWNQLLPEGREKSMALSFLDQAMWAANAAIARGHAQRDAEGAAFEALGAKGPKA